LGYCKYWKIPLPSQFFHILGKDNLEHQMDSAAHATVHAVYPEYNTTQQMNFPAPEDNSENNICVAHYK
jgi:hypothetical protein